MNFLIFAEIVGDDALLLNYVGQNVIRNSNEKEYPRLDACLDFPLYYMLEDVVKGRIAASNLRDRYASFQKLLSQLWTSRFLFCNLPR